MLESVEANEVWEKMRVNNNISASGCNKAHNMPSAVCLYLTLISLQVKK